jgi:uncharacterized membrane protein
MFNTRLRSFLWGLTVVYGVFAMLKGTNLGQMQLKALIPAISILVPTFFAFAHGIHRLGGKTMAVFFLIAFVISWTMESTSIATGFPFGHYHYTEKLGPKLGTVPLLIMPAYFAMCYVSWNLAHIVLDKFDKHSDSLQRFAIPLVAAFIMVMWDLSMDPARATVHQAWLWHDGGSYFGVPFVNFVGWFLTVYLIFQVFALWIARWPSTAPSGSDDTDRSAWMLNIAFYFATFLEFVAMAALAPQNSVTDPAGVVWSTKAMYESLGLVSIFTMGFVSLLGFIKVRNNPNLS